MHLAKTRLSPTPNSLFQKLDTLFSKIKAWREQPKYITYFQLPPLVVWRFSGLGLVTFHATALTLSISLCVRPVHPRQKKNMTMRFRPLFTIENKHFTSSIHFILRKVCWSMNAAHTASSQIWGYKQQLQNQKSVTFILCMTHHSKGSLRCIWSLGTLGECSSWELRVRPSPPSPASGDPEI